MFLTSFYSHHILLPIEFCLIVITHNFTTNTVFLCVKVFMILCLDTQAHFC